MTKIALPFTLLVTALVCLLPTAPAQALAARTFVSAAGSDSNNCTNVASPCRHLAAAYAATAPNGEIYVLDPANYGSLTISGAVSIEGHGWASIAPVTGQAAITIAANPGDKINIIGVVLDGTALANTTGILFESGGSLIVRDSVIRNFASDGISFQPNTSSESRISVSNTLISDNGGVGINIDAFGSGTTNGILDNVDINNSGDFGLDVGTSSQTINITVSDSVIANGASVGIFASGGGTPLNIMVRHSTITNNSGSALEAFNAGATVRVTRSTLTGNTAGWSAFSGGAVLSYADNNIDGNESVNTEPPSPLSYK
jgi:hypothetical protein